MFDEVFGLPAHPLIVHAPVVLVPLTAAVAAAYGILVPLRRHLGWLLALLSLAAAGSAFVAVLSGKEFEKRLGATPQIERHAGFGENLRNVALALAVVAVALVVVDLRRRPRKVRADGPGAAVDSGARGAEASKQRRPALGVVSLVLTVVLLVLAAVATYYVVRVGHSGSEMVWGS
jgi:uncharacterized membrane protein